jgi:hypothetical protein
VDAQTLIEILRDKLASLQFENAIQLAQITELQIQATQLTEQLERLFAASERVNPNQEGTATHG